MACLSCVDAFRDKWVSRNLRDRAKSFSWEMTLLTLGMFLHTQTESVLIKMAWTGWNTLFHACVCEGNASALAWNTHKQWGEQELQFINSTSHWTAQTDLHPGKYTRCQMSVQKIANHVVQICCSSESCYKFVESLTNMLFKLLLLRWRKRGNLWY